MTNSGASGGLPMTHRAGGEFHGPLGHARSDLSEIASPKQNFWGIFEGPDVSKRIHFRLQWTICPILVHPEVPYGATELGMCHRGPLESRAAI
jgi:hypothetical protein